MKNAIRLASIWYFRAEARPLPPTGGFLKRLFDIVGALGGLVLLAPLLLMVALLVKLTDGGSVFYGHTRIGHNGNEFKCLKFRTMVVDGDRVLDAHLRKYPGLAQGMGRDAQAEERPARHPCRGGAAQAQHRRTAAAHQHPGGGHEHCRTRARSSTTN